MRKVITNIVATSIAMFMCGVAIAQTPIEETILLASDGAEWDQFGYSVSVSGDTVVAGARYDDDNGSDSGSAYIYRFDGSNWIETKLLASDGAEDDHFGSSVTVSGDIVVVGARQNDDNGSDSGSAYIFRFDGSSWTETKLLASDGANNDHFGSSVAVSNDTVVVGALHDDTNGTNSGCAYVYHFEIDNGWIETKLLASDGASGDEFGKSVSVSGDTVVVGARWNSNKGSYTGSAYVYRLDGSSWIETKLVSSDGAFGDLYGDSVSVSGDTVVVGATYDDDNGTTSGSAYIYRFDGSNWIETKLLASDGAEGDYFGSSVAVTGDIVVVGAKNNDDNGSNSGSAYEYRFDGSNWIETKLLASDGASNDYFGYSVSVDGDTVVVGVYGDDNIAYIGGSAYVFDVGEVDSDGDGVPDNIDNCYLYNPDQEDCNNNGIGDVCDVADSTSPDCDRNGVPDECQPDCDGDGWIDPCDNEGDCDGDGIPDNCETDCQPNGIPDDCDIIFGISQDCNENGVPDECDIADGTVEDCNENGIPDNCELADPDNDQNNNGVLDECECVGDADLDGYVNVNDLLIIIGYWGNSTPQADLNFDGIVDVTDLLIVVGNWGPCE